MATKFYFDSATAPAISPAVDGGWTNSSNLIRRRLNSVPQNSVLTDTRINNVTVVQNWTMYQFVSAPINAQTISGTFSFVIKALGNSGSSMFCVQRIRVLSGDGTSVTGTLSSTTYPAGASGVFPQATEATVIISAQALSSVTANQGDRIVFEIGLRNNNVSTDGGTMKVGDAGGSDYAITAGLTTDLNPYISFSGAITMAPTMASKFFSFLSA